MDPSVPLRGVVDLSALAPSLDSSQSSFPLGAFRIEVTEDTFQALAEQSMKVPVILSMGIAGEETSEEVNAQLDAAVTAQAGRVLLATCDVNVHASIAQAFQVETVPAVVALIAGRPAPLFQGIPPAGQIQEFLTQVVQLAAQNGVTGSVEPRDVEAADDEEPVEEPLPPLHQEAFDAIEREDFAAAIAAYERALLENPRDLMARAGLAQVKLLLRTLGADLQALRAAAAASPESVPAQMAVADMDVLGGQIDDAFDRLLELVVAVPTDEREPLRLRLVELFDIVGAEDERVMRARRRLAAALY